MSCLCETTGAVHDVDTMRCDGCLMLAVQKKKRSL